MIKKLTLFMSLFFCSSAFAQYDIAVTINGLTCDDELLLANHFGDKQYLRDTSECKNGVFHFTGREKLKTGVYLVVLPKKNYFEILVSTDENQMKYAFTTDTTLSPKITTSKGSKENELFFEFNKLAVEQGILGSQLKKSYDAETDETVKKELSEQLKNISTLVSAKRSAIAKSNPTLFIGTLYLAMEEVKAIELEQNINKEEARKNQYLWMREHYWDNVTMSEDGLMLSPVFHNKLKDYFDNYMIPVPDSAIAMADVLINRIEKGGSKEQYKYTIHYLLRYFEESKYMCMDKALWHMAKNYYCAGKAFWADSAYVAKMCEESNKMEPTLCDVLAPEMSMPDTTFTKRISMQAIDKPVTVLVFWDINCGHCKKEMPIINAMYDSMTNEHFEIYAVYTQGDWEGWKKRLAKEKYDFVNVANAFGDDKFREYYNIRTTPQIFVLDKDKKIRFKKIGAHDIANTIQFLLEEQGVVEPEKKE